MQQATRKSLDALTGARFLAALWVLLYHYSTDFRFNSIDEQWGYRDGPHGPFDMLFLQGHLAVDFFFLLSGFILAYTYILPDGGLRGTRRMFWVARIARIYPVYLLGLVLGFFPYIWVENDPLTVVGSAIAHISMLHGWFPSTLEWNQPSWSLSVEAFFYLLFPLLVPLFAKCRRRGLWMLAIGSWLLFAIALVVLTILTTYPEVRAIPNWRDLVRYNPLVSLPEFTAGMALGLLFVRFRGDAIPWLRRIRVRGYDIAILAMSLGLVGVLVVAYKLKIRGEVVDTLAPIVLPFMAALIYFLAFQRGIITQILSIPVMVWLGEISYAVYILHKPIWYLLSRFAADTLNVAHNDVGLLIAYLALVLLVCGFSFRFIERPARQYIRAHWGQPSNVPAKVPVSVESAS